MRKIVEGVLIFDRQSERYQVNYGIEKYSDGLHCGECLAALDVKGRWINYRIEYCHEIQRWYLVGMNKKFSLDGAKVRYEI